VSGQDDILAGRGLATDRLARQLAFLAEVDRLKGVERRTRTIGGERRENSAEHSWHLALALLVLAEHAPPGVEILRAVRMALIHDLVEIDAGDSFVYDESAMGDKREREIAAAERLFPLLPLEQAEEMRRLWDEFEEGATPDARFAGAIDRFCGMLLNWHNAGGTWREHGVSADQVFHRNSPIGEAVPVLWACCSGWIDHAVREGWIAEKRKELQT